MQIVFFNYNTEIVDAHIKLQKNYGKKLKL